MQDGIESLDLKGFAEYEAKLPGYAYRYSSAFKRHRRYRHLQMVKGDLREQAYNIDVFDDPCL